MKSCFTDFWVEALWLSACSWVFAGGDQRLWRVGIRSPTHAEAQTGRGTRGSSENVQGKEPQSNTCRFVFDLIVEFLGGTGFCLFDYRLVFAPLCILPMLHALCYASLEPKSKKNTSHGAFRKFGAWSNFRSHTTVTCWASRGQLPLPPGWTKKESRSKVRRSHGKLSRASFSWKWLWKPRKKSSLQRTSRKAVFFLMLLFWDIGSGLLSNAER